MSGSNREKLVVAALNHWRDKGEVTVTRPRQLWQGCPHDSTPIYYSVSYHTVISYMQGVFFQINTPRFWESRQGMEGKKENQAWFCEAGNSKEKP